jgi:hypothetical protein
MENIKEIVADLMECYDGNGTPNQHYIKNKVTELHDIVKNINYNTVLETVTCDECYHECNLCASYCEACGNVLG